MAAGDIILSNGSTITASEVAEIAAEVKKLIAKEAKEPSQYEEVGTLANLTTLPALKQDGSVYKLVRVAVELLKGMDGKEVSLRKTDTALQWRLGDQGWIDLLQLSEIKGEKGDQGEQGLQGIQGIQGEKGDKGDQGEQGIQGIQGIQGEKGDTGEKGEKGDQGDPFTYDDFTAEQIEELKSPATEAAEVALSLSQNLPKIEGMTWRVYNPTTKQYEDSGVDATGRPPMIQSGTWWLWDYATQSYVDSGQAVNTDYKAYVPRVYPKDIDLKTLSTYEEDGETKDFVSGNLIYVENELEPTGYSVFIYTPHGGGYAWVKIVLITDGMHLILVQQ